MYDPEFERQVREKMEELSFSPSESVWTNVQKDLQKDKKRRVPLGWIFLCAGLILGGIYFAFVGKSGSPEKIAVSKTFESPAVHPVNPVYTTKTNNSRSPDGSASAVLPPAEGKMKSRGQSMQAGSTLPSEKGPASAAFNDHRFKSIQDNIVADELEAGHNAEKNSAGPPGGRDQQENAGSMAAQKTQSNIAQLKQPAPPETAKTEVKLDKQHRWKFGFSGSAGISNVFQTVTAQKAVTSPFYNPSIYYNSNNTTSRVLGAAPPPPPHSPSTEQAGFSFAAGGFVQRSITRKIYFTLGLNYHYYSSSIQTGNKVNLNNFSAFASAAINPAYLYGSSYTHMNRYHFLELPVSLGYKIIQSRKHPVTMDAGLSFSRVLGSDALYYNESTGTYMKNNGILNKVQVMANSALMVGFVRQKMLIQLGPQVQYGVSTLLTSPSGNKEHLFFGGIKILLQSNK
jgi:hypothetical protein